MTRPDAVAIVPAAGAGLRMGGATRKQYLKLDGVPILIVTLRALVAVERIGAIVVAAPEEDIDAVSKMVADYGVNKIEAVVVGGKTRHESVERGLAVAPADYPLVVVHDAVRPLTTAAMFEACLAEAERVGGAVVATPVKDTLKRVADGMIVEGVDRDDLVRIQTPQAFRRTVLNDAFVSAKAVGFVGTDESSLVIRAGDRVAVVAGDETNLKVTTPDDLALARLIVTTRKEAP